MHFREVQRKGKIISFPLFCQPVETKVWDCHYCDAAQAARTKSIEVNGTSLEELLHYPPSYSYGELAAPAHSHSMELQLLSLHAWPCACCLVQRRDRMWPLVPGHRVPQTHREAAQVEREVLAACVVVMRPSWAPGQCLLLPSLPPNGHLLLWFTPAHFCQLPAWPGEFWGTSY